MKPVAIRRRPNRVVSCCCALALGMSMATGARADTPTIAPHALAAAAEAAWDLGAVVDMRRAGRDGLEVLAVTPGGAAARMGLQTGDRIRALNARPLTGSAAAQAYGDALAASNGQVRLEVVRDGAPLQLSGSADPAPAQGMEGCGYVTTIGATPRLRERIYSAEITMIDGRSTPLSPQNRHELPAGRRVLVVAERIEDHQFNNSQNLQRGIMKRREMARAYKAFVVDVAPDTTYSIGARLLEEQLDSASIRANRYWEPVIWKTAASRCR